MDGQRRAITEAVHALVARGGVRAATVRAVAAEAGLSMGSVRHFFGSQDELRRFAMTELVVAVEARLAAGAAERARRVREGGIDAVVEAAASVCDELLPLDEVRETEARVYAAFLAEAPVDSGIAAIRDETAGVLHDGIAEVVATMAGLGALGAGRDQEVETDRLWALVDGLTAHLLDHPDRLTRDRARAALRAHLVDLTAPGRQEE